MFAYLEWSYKKFKFPKTYQYKIKVALFQSLCYMPNSSGTFNSRQAVSLTSDFNNLTNGA